MPRNEEPEGMFSSKSRVQAELRRDKVHPVDMKCMITAGWQAVPDASDGRFGGIHCLPSKETLTPWLVSRLFTRNKMSKRHCLVLFLSMHLVLWSDWACSMVWGRRKKGRERGEERFSLANDWKQPSQGPPLTCQDEFLSLHHLKCWVRIKHYSRLAVTTFSRSCKPRPSLSTSLDWAGPGDSGMFLGIISEMRSLTQGRSTPSSSHKGFHLWVLQWGLWLIKHFFLKTTFHSSMC